MFMRKKRILLRKELFYCISDFSMYYSVNWVDRSFVQNDKCIRLAFSRCFNLPRLDFYRIWLGRKMEFLLLQNTIITSTYNLKRFKSNMLNKVKCGTTHLKDDNDFFSISDPDLSWILSHIMRFSIVKIEGGKVTFQKVSTYTCIVVVYASLKLKATKRVWKVHQKVTMHVDKVVFRYL